MNKKLLIYLILITSSFLWGISFVFTEKIFSANPDISPFLLVTLRLLVAIIFFAGIFVFSPIKLEKILKKDLLAFFGLALFEPFLYFIGESYGIKYCSFTIASVIVATIPVFVPFAVFFVYKESLKWYNIFGICCSLIGIAVMTIAPGADLSAKGIGIFFLLFAVLSAVMYAILLQGIIKKYKPTTVTFYQNLIGFIYFLPMAFIFDYRSIIQLSFSGQTIFYIIILGILCSSIAFLLYNYSVKMIGISKACIFNNLIPVFTLLTVAVLGTEKLFFEKILGMFIVIFGVLITQLSVKKVKNLIPMKSS